ncbi:ABC transporter permease [Ureibacillus terrenus]|uniref:ABC transporter permease n=1 Tax=Ureibacillus terrenus TaxID=118246 RepID=A0A540V6V5_9BACL|nr:ABC transporter permease [Ureibacillus terrenus]MED3660481.1 ABC transporter permease [Ureibacillus terrenus]TQE92486.1 ABC transporter permease [Ureibacillus terrenus]
MIIKRILILPVLLLVISFLTFLLTSIVPGDIAEGIILKQGGQPTEETVAAMNEQLGLDRGLFARYGQWLIQALQLDLGTSWVSGEPVAKELAERIVPTLWLTSASLVISVLITMFFGTAAAYFRDTAVDKAILGFSLIMNCIPEFLLAFILLFFFAYKWDIFPLVGYGSLEHLILPSLVLGFGIGAGKARLLRSSILDAMNSNYVAMARAKGLTKWQALKKHALRNALIPIVTSFGSTVGFLLGGSVIIENIFNWPGLGRLALQAINSRDIPVLQGYVLFATVFIIGIYLIVDLLYMLIDPRVYAKRSNIHG